ncbi:hypothetical protein [Pseudomonas syringae group genomosp. 7]|uniref:hypothetical protein n=1 Tax=Pseudomonas syringae group genomosp. 7 TaxID=251699 RepID=UPI0011EA6299|nr:hypothetical protein [Pseudomonas syringae group genomosp. 7]UNB61880.1 hypothetical protein MME54_19920 [Pseudomonas syringae pv. helianthi]
MCNKDAERFEPEGDYEDLSCAECGRYRITGTVIRMWEKARWIHTVAMQQWIEEQRRGGAEIPLINSEVVVWEGLRSGS